MRKTLQTIVIGGLALCALNACTHSETIPYDIRVKTDSVTINNKVGNFSIKADCPTSKTEALTSTINEWLSETMGGTYEGGYNETMLLQSIILIPLSVMTRLIMPN